MVPRVRSDVLGLKEAVSSRQERGGVGVCEAKPVRLDWRVSYFV